MREKVRREKVFEGKFGYGKVRRENAEEKEGSYCKKEGLGGKRCKVEKENVK